MNKSSILFKLVKSVKKIFGLIGVTLMKDMLFWYILALEICIREEFILIIFLYKMSIK